MDILGKPLEFDHFIGGLPRADDDFPLPPAPDDDDEEAPAPPADPPRLRPVLPVFDAAAAAADDDPTPEESPAIVLLPLPLPEEPRSPRVPVFLDASLFCTSNLSIAAKSMTFRVLTAVNTGAVLTRFVEAAGNKASFF